jgi:hypothetical protein
MIIQLVLFSGLLLVLYLLIRRAAHADPVRRAQLLRWVTATMVTVLLLLVVRGGIAVTVSLLVMCLPVLLRYWQTLWRSPPLRGSRNETAGIGREEAYEILGLQPGATKEQIKAAHRRLMQRVHPDHGGSDYLAVRVNQAKDLLLGG